MDQNQKRKNLALFEYQKNWFSNWEYKQNTTKIVNFRLKFRFLVKYKKNQISDSWVSDNNRLVCKFMYDMTELTSIVQVFDTRNWFVYAFQCICNWFDNLCVLNIVCVFMRFKFKIAIVSRAAKSKETTKSITNWTRMWMWFGSNQIIQLILINEFWNSDSQFCVYLTWFLCAIRFRSFDRQKSFDLSV